MNPVFWFLIILGLVALWFILSPVFKSLGDSAVDVVDKAKKEMFDETRKDN